MINQTPIKLSRIVEAINMLSCNTTAYINRETFQFVMIPEEAFRVAENGDFLDDHWQSHNDILKLTNDFLAHRAKYLRLPNSFYVLEYRIMEDFCYSFEDKSISEALMKAMTGSAAFRLFKKAVVQLGIDKCWQKFHETAIERIAVDWCTSNSVNFIYD